MNNALRLPMQAAWLGMLVLAGSSSVAQTLPGIPGIAPPQLNSNYTSAPISLDGQVVFTIAAPINRTGQLPVGERANDIEAVIRQIIGSTNDDDRPTYDPRTLRVRIQREGAANVLQVVDSKHKDPLSVVTVTAADAAQRRVATSVLAAEWQEALQGSMVHAIVIREPRVMQRHVMRAVIVAVLLLLLTIAGALVLRRLGARIAALAIEVEAEQKTLESIAGRQQPATNGETEEHHTRRAQAAFRRALRPARRLTAFRGLRDLFIWTLLLAWCGGVAWVALLFPQSTPLGHTFVRNGLVIASIVIVTGLIDRALTIAIGRLPMIWELRHFANADERARQTLRMPTIVRAMNGFKTFVLVFIGALSALTQIGIPVGSVVTIGGVAAIAVSLAAQNLIRDVVSGFLVLSEDQFVLGDFVTINGASGIVERLTLRMVQLRDGSGGLVTISHSAATSVVNHSRNWSRLDFAVAIDADADAGEAVELIRSAIERLADENAWHDAIEKPLEWIGVDGLSRDGIVIRARIKTAPLRQFALQREMNLRVSRAFRDAKIGYGAPVATVSATS